jgi:hypothetical protein
LRRERKREITSKRISDFHWLKPFALFFKRQDAFRQAEPKAIIEKRIYGGRNDKIAEHDQNAIQIMPAV